MNSIEKPLVARLVEALEQTARSADPRPKIDTAAPQVVERTLKDYDPLEALEEQNEMLGLGSEARETVREYKRDIVCEAPTDARTSSAASAANPHPVSLDTEGGVPRGQALEPAPTAAKLEHLYYGGTGPSKNQPRYRHNCKPEPGKTFKTQKRFELICRMENAGLAESAIAPMIGISVPRLRALKRSREYLKARIKITHGLILDQDLSIAQIKEQRREMLVQMLPPALQVIANAVNTTPSCFAERKLQTEIARDILDREGTFAKISRTEVKPVDHFDWGPTDTSAAQIIQIMRGAISQTKDGTVDIRAAQLIEISKAFTKGSSISPEEATRAVKTLDAEGIEPPEGWAR